MKAKGKCFYCKKAFSKQGMSKHLLSCPILKDKIEALSMQNNTIFFLILVEQEPYWFYVQIPDYYTLRDLDELLRREWLECCGHLSCFKIRYTTYDCYNDGGEDICGEKPESMDIKLKEVLDPGVTFSHDYDFGTTTTLKLKVIEHYKSPLSPQLTIIARNDPPEFLCEICDGVADRICACCHETTCTKCICKHCCLSEEDPEDYMYSLVNSPRTGICGYTGY